MPIPLQDFRVRVNPLRSSFSLAMPIDRSWSVKADCSRCRFSALATKYYAAHLIAKAFDVLRVGGTTEAVGETKEFLLLRFSASIPLSMSSTSIRVALSWRLFAMPRTCAEMVVGRLTL